MEMLKRTMLAPTLLFKKHDKGCLFSAFSPIPFLQKGVLLPFSPSKKAFTFRLSLKGKREKGEKQIKDERSKIKQILGFVYPI
jgi:hypothetical protein